jgi:hypothetical protein
MGREIERPFLHHQRALPSTAAAHLAMRMLFIIAVLMGPALMMCIGLLGVLEDLMMRKPTLRAFHPLNFTQPTRPRTRLVANRIDRIHRRSVMTYQAHQYQLRSILTLVNWYDF